MRPDIINFILNVCEKYGWPLSLNYYPPNGPQEHDIYSCHLKGRAILNFTSRNFYDLAKSERERHFTPLIRVGMNENLAEESMKDQVHVPRNQGIRVIRDGVLKYGV